MKIERIAYGVNSQGFGHTSRSLAVIKELQKNGYDVLVFTGRESVAFMRDQNLKVVEIPAFENIYDLNGNIAEVRTVLHNLAPGLKMKYDQGWGMKNFIEEYRKFSPDVAISDTDAWTSRRAIKEGTPLISLDHSGVFAFCDIPEMPPEVLKEKNALGRGYKFLFKEGEYKIVSNSYPAVPVDENTRVVGPILRSEVTRMSAKNSGHVLVYFNNPRIFSDKIRSIVGDLGQEVYVYGANKEGRDGNILFKRKSPRGFLEDLASCDFVISGMGNQMFGEVVYLAKPGLFIPGEREQKINAWAMNHYGLSVCREMDEVSVEDIHTLKEKRPEFIKNMKKFRKDWFNGGNALADAMKHLYGFFRQIEEK